MHRWHSSVVLWVVFTCSALCGRAFSLPTGHRGTPSISCLPTRQPEFEKAVALLHSFQYAEAESLFSNIAEGDPQCAMAYWGQAMGLYQQLWGQPGPETLKKGHDLIEKAIK